MRHAKTHHKNCIAPWNKNRFARSTIPSVKCYMKTFVAPSTPQTSSFNAMPFSHSDHPKKKYIHFPTIHILMILGVRVVWHNKPSEDSPQYSHSNIPHTATIVWQPDSHQTPSNRPKSPKTISYTEIEILYTRRHNRSSCTSHPSIQHDVPSNHLSSIRDQLGLTGGW